MTKPDEIDAFIQRKVREALAELAMDNPELNDVLRQQRTTISNYVSSRIISEYGFLELADIMEWKRSRVRR